MLKNFPILSDEKIDEYTKKGYVLVFRYLKAIDDEQPVEILNEADYKKAIQELEKYPYYDKITRAMPFREGYKLLMESNTQYNLRSQLARELKSWASHYNISDETAPEVRQRFLENVKPF